MIVATLGRDTLQRTVSSVRIQKAPHELLVRIDPEVNEYVSRERAIADARGDILAFLDDDAHFNFDTLAKVIPYFDRGYGFVQGICYVQGRPFAHFGTGVGTATFMLKSAFREIGGYNYSITSTDARGTKGNGWRLDTCLLYDFMEKFGEDRYTLAKDVLVQHPENMKGFFNPEAEEKFYLHYRKYVDKYILPIDPRLQAFVKDRGLN